MSAKLKPHAVICTRSDDATLGDSRNGCTYSNVRHQNGCAYTTRGDSSPTPPPESPSYDDPENLDSTLFILKVVENSPSPKYRREQILWLMNDLIKTGGRKPEGSPINSKYVHHRIGKSAFADAKKLGLITKVKPHQAGVCCARYQLRHPSATPATYTLTSKSLIERRGSIENAQKCRLKAANFSPELFDHLKAFTAPEAFRAKANEILRAMLEAGKDTKSTVASFEFVESERHRLSVKLGRLTNHIVGLPSDLRMCLRCNGSPVAEVDISSSHPTFLAHIFRPRQQAQLKEHADYIRLLNDRRFYESFEPCWEEDRHLFKDYTHKGKKGADCIELLERDFLTLPARKGIKLCWQVILNGKGNPARLFTSKTWQEFTHMFPIMAKRIAGMKRKNPSSLGNILRSEEAEFVNGVATALKGPVATLYDGWLVAESDAEPLRLLCCRISTELFGFKINPTIKYAENPGPHCRKIVI